MHECGAAYRRRGRGRYAPAAAGVGLAVVEEYVAGASRDIRTRAAGLTPTPRVDVAVLDAGSRDGDEGSSQGEVAARLAAHVLAAGEHRSGRRSSATAALLTTADLKPLMVAGFCLSSRFLHVSLSRPVCLCF